MDFMILKMRICPFTVGGNMTKKKVSMIKSCFNILILINFFIEKRCLLFLTILNK